ncbi:hypothetical protein LEP1GSC036_0743 [Leptospira weilii str. 2006001853]|uniref:Uncharacterized protein n=1 Tax=Leptospira weilii str. 2006001853 TaxID=1001589 RepID=A0A828Z9K6_9LEPT|nr:hypothetical protein LEP1GSC036_0743 [Leptospira weilii str. 2006001853]EMJ62679.1 hypothetical protein LEP1GSC051_3946 [Leptospira sp. P2653]EMN46668.1 hypothetical protein LEP1GSC086_4098 [Leptospira weilii str. LNT 1234]OMI17859.1 hypothetical protein BUQ74_07915 [Leptospira weilii serovar Heyan]QDK23768.1 hypothetical protein FHG67_14325 [Leptospira weilii]
MLNVLKRGTRFRQGFVLQWIVSNYFYESYSEPYKTVSGILPLKRGFVSKFTVFYSVEIANIRIA